MNPSMSIPLTQYAVTLHDAVAALDWPTTAVAGGDITNWRSGSFAPRFVLLEIENQDDADVDISNIILAAHLAGGGDTAWASWKTTIDTLTIAAGGKHYLPMPADAACSLFDRWAIDADVAGGATPLLGVRAIPLEVWGN